MKIFSRMKLHNFKMFTTCLFKLVIRMLSVLNLSRLQALFSPCYKMLSKPFNFFEKKNRENKYTLTKLKKKRFFKATIGRVGGNSL